MSSPKRQPTYHVDYVEVSFATFVKILRQQGFTDEEVKAITGMTDEEFAFNVGPESPTTH